MTLNKHPSGLELSFIEHIIEPNKLLLVWQSPDENCARIRYVVAEIVRKGDEIILSYLTQSSDFTEAKNLGFAGYPAFQETSLSHNNVLDALMRRLPPKTRGDFDLYLEGIRLSPNNDLSNFGLLGYSGAKLPSDEFSIVHPFENVEGEFELLIEATGYRHLFKDHRDIQIKEPVSFEIEKQNSKTNEPAIRIVANKKVLGYVTRALMPTFLEWLEDNRISNAWVEKVNGMPGRPSVYVFVKISKKNN